MEVQFVNFDIFDEITMNKIKKSTEPLINKFGKFFGENSLLDFKMDLKKIHEDAGGKTLFEVIGSLDTTLGKFRTTEKGWEILTVIYKLIDELERQILEKKERLKMK